MGNGWVLTAGNSMKKKSCSWVWNRNSSDMCKLALKNIEFPVMYFKNGRSKPGQAPV